MSEETERLNKLTLSSRKQAAKVNSCSYDIVNQEQNACKVAQCGEKGKRDTLMMTLEAVKTGIATIKSSMATSNSQAKSGNGSRQKQPVQNIK